MKASAKKISFTTYPLGTGNSLQPNDQKDDSMTFTNFTVPNQFAEQQIAPPSHVWDKIAGILDAQDRHKALVEKTAFTSNHGVKKHSTALFIAGIACIVVAVVIWMVY